MKAIKYSRQRESIKEFLSTRTDHPTADTVYMNIRREYPNISLGTVYRNLALLVSLGEIQKVSCGDGVEHFDPNAKPHYHFVCKECGAVKDLAMKPLEKLDAIASEDFDGSIMGHTAFFYGLCRECKEKMGKVLDKDRIV